MGKPSDVLAFVEAEATRGDPKSVLATMDRYATEYAFLMNVGPEKGALLCEQVRRVGGDARIVGFGAYCGYSAILIASQLCEEGRVISIEKDAESVHASRQTIAFAGLEDRVAIIEGSSQDVIPTLEGSFDLVFLDHWKDLYEGDLKSMEAQGLLHSGSVVFADNVGPSFNPEDYLKYVQTSGRYESEHFKTSLEYSEIPDAVEISIYRG